MTFRIPFALIHLDWSIVLASLAAIMATYAVLYLILRTMYDVVPERFTIARARETALGREILFWAYAGMLLLIGGFLEGFRSRSLWISAVSLAALAALRLVTPLFVRRAKEGGYRTNFEAFYRPLPPYSRSLEADALRRLIRAYGLVTGRVVVLFIISALPAFGAGDSRAATQRTFYVVAGDPTLVVLRIWGDRAVASRLTPSAHTLDNSIVLIGLFGSEPLVLVRRDIGPLMSTSP